MLVALVLVAGLLIAVLNPGGGDPDVVDGAPPTVQPPAATSTPGQAPSAAVPTTAPNDVSWELVGPLAVPVSTTGGPRQTGDTTASGFAHTPEGALIAAAQIGMRSSYSLGREYWEPTIERQFIPSTDRDRLLESLETTSDAPADPGSLSQIAGFSYQSYTPDTAVIGLVLRAPSAGTPRYHVLSLTLLWRDDDWRMQAPPGGAWVSVNRVTNDLTGVVEWGAR
ncbi:hypothetical protein [Micromonospora tarapacensis]|uniref:hypothetical protein n=1 Tax=Micromonospora tarapacensis TaxID=2835305 RepID=UPI002F3F023F